MQINIEVNETQFKDIMEKSLAELPKEKIQEVLLEGMKKYIAESDMIQGLLIDGDRYSTRLAPTRFLLNLIDKMTTTDDLNDIRDEMLNVLRTNYDKILREALTQTLVNGICSYNNDSFRSAVEEVLLEQMTKTNN